MGKEFSKPESIGSLELYLNDVFQKECAYHLEEEEVDFIHTGVETLVKKIASNIKDDNTFQEEMERMFAKYFTGKLMKSQANIFGAGSFYEGTKNSFPDEFDFILNLYCIEGTPEQYKKYLLEAAIFNTVNDTFAQIVKEISERNKHALQYSSPNGVTANARKVYFETFLTKHGPATWLKFIYENELGQKREINIDYVPALRITDKRILEHVVKESCALAEFAKVALSVGSCFCIGANYSFTETEVHIMRNILSEKHRQIYRILKFLINGNGDGENLRDFFESLQKPYCSYMMKTMMIHHHYECKSSDKDCLGPCLLEVVDAMCKYRNSSEFPSLYKTFYDSRLRCDLPLASHLQSLADHLRSLQVLPTSSYNYEKDRVKMSVSKRFKDDKQMCVETTLYERCASTKQQEM